MNRDDLRRAPGGNQQRMRGMHDVDVAGERLDRRPFEAVPEVVQDGDRHPPIDDARAKLARQGRATAGPSTSW